MSIVAKFSVYTHCNDIGGKLWNPAIKWTKKYAVFIVLEDDKGLSGLGECWCFDSKPDALVQYLKTEIAPFVVGMDVKRSSGIYQQLLSRATLTARHGMLASAWSGVDIALWDMRSSEAGQPLWQYLQAQHPRLTNRPDSDVTIYGSGGLYGKDKKNADLTKEMQAINAAGFNLVKMKVGGLSLDKDVERVLSVVDGLNSNCNLIIDGVYSYTQTEALQLYSILPAERIEAFQSPLKAHDVSGMSELCKQGVPVMAIEAEYRQEIYQRLIELNAVKYLQLAPIACGGISQLIALQEQLLSSESEIQLSLEVSSTAIALIAAYHFALACDTVAHVECHQLHQVFFNEVGLSASHNGITWQSSSNGKGIGITLDNLPVQAEFELLA